MEDIIEKHLQEWEAKGLNQLPDEVAVEMSDPEQDEDEEWRIWKAIPSTVTEAELKAVEALIGYELPPSYKRFLGYKHFYEFKIGPCTFCSHPIHYWRGCLSEMIFRTYPEEYLMGKGLIPFAAWSDWGALCFDSSNRVGNEYQIVRWDHEKPHETELIFNNINHLLNDLDKNSVEYRE
ncbi:MAG: SMI1/KNR4 family protein [Bacteroidota bacterium]